MSWATILLAFSAGMVAAINPCGFALLPAYLSYYLGLESASGVDGGPAVAPLRRAAIVSAATTGGFVLVFVLIGAMWSAVSGVVADQLPWAIVVVGVALVGLGIAMVAGFVPTVRLPKVATSSGSQSGWSAFVFGISYGVASLSCTIAPFIGAVSSTFGRHSWVTGVATLTAYAIGMGAIVTLLTVSVSLARKGVANRMRRMLPHMGRISGVLVVLSGLLAIYYGRYEAKVLTGATVDGGLAASISGWRDSIARWIHDVGEERLGIAIAIVLVGIAAVAWTLRHPGPGTDDPDPPALDGAGAAEPAEPPAGAAAGQP